jgi:large subunit ribosomal protein L18e
MKNEKITQLISMLKEKSNSESVKVWKAIALELSKPTRKKRIVNLFKIDKNSAEDDIIIVPGKVLATGELNHKITIAAESFSESAISKINKVKGQAISIEKLVEMNPKAEKIKILG